MNPRTIIRLRRMRGLGQTISDCARMCRMDRKTAARYLDESVPIRKVKEPRTYRTRKDPIEAFWPEIEAMLNNDKLLKPYMILEYLMDKHKDAFPASYQRSLERRIAQWRIDNQVEKEVTFDQVHWLADVLAMDFTDMTPLAITIRGERFEHKVFHSVLTYSNWEYAQVCFSESFEAVADGLQNSFLAIGGVTHRVRFDSLSAAVNNLAVDKQFRSNFHLLLEHFGTEPHRINVRSPNENGDCESLHGHFKDYVDQRLRLRLSREFDSIDDYKNFLKECLAKRNDSRQAAFKAEKLELDPLPRGVFPTYTTLDVRVKSNSVITVKQNRYAVPSCLIGFKVQVRIYADTVELWYLSKKQFQMPRLIGKDKEYIDFRYVIDSLVRKPNAFESYRYREHMYPTLEFRKAFDSLVKHFGDHRAIRLYLKILHTAKQENVATLQGLLTQINSNVESLTAATITAKLKELHSTDSGSVDIDVNVETPDLDDYDGLLEHKEVLNEPATQPNEPAIKGVDNDSIDASTQPIRTGFPFETTSVADDAIPGTELGTASGPGELEPFGLLGRTDDDGVPYSNRESRSPSSETIEAGTLQNMVPDQLEPNSIVGSSPDGSTSDGRVPKADEQCSRIRSTWLGENVIANRVRRNPASRRSHRMLCPMLVAGSTSAACEEGAKTTTVAEQTWTSVGVDHRRSWLCSTIPRGDGSALYTDSRPLRKVEYSIEFESTILEMGKHLQGPDDNGGRHRSTRTSQYDSGAEHTQLPTRRGEPGTPEASRFLQTESFPWGFLIAAKVEM